MESVSAAPRRQPMRGQRSAGATQFSLLITVVVLSAIVPTAIAQRFFEPTAGQRLGAESDPAERGAPSPPREPAPEIA